MNKDLILREKLALQRTILANQSTFLSFLRTSMYFLVAGISVNNLLDIKYGKLVEIIFFIVAGSLLTLGIVNYKTQQRKILESKKHIGNYQDDYLTTNDV
jgi:putative membrane protein